MVEIENKQRSNLCVIGVPNDDKQNNEPKLKTIIQENFMEIEDLNTHIVKDHQALEKTNPQDIPLLDSRDKEKFFKISKQKDQIIQKGKI